MSRIIAVDFDETLCHAKPNMKLINAVFQNEVKGVCEPLPERGDGSYFIWTSECPKHSLYLLQQEESELWKNLEL